MTYVISPMAAHSTTAYTQKLCTPLAQEARLLELKCPAEARFTGLVVLE